MECINISKNRELQHGGDDLLVARTLHRAEVLPIGHLKEIVGNEDTSSRRVGIWPTTVDRGG